MSDTCLSFKNIRHSYFSNNTKVEELFGRLIQKIENPTDQLIEVSHALRNMLRPNGQASQNLAAQVIINLVEDGKTLSL